MSEKASRKYTLANDIPVEKWGRDHWSLLGYVRSIESDAAGFRVWADPRMRIAGPKRILMNGKRPGIDMDDKYGSRPKDGSYIPGHDDIDCLWDFCKAGLLTIDKVQDVKPDGVIHLSEKGVALANALQQHKASGGSFSTFRCQHEVPRHRPRHVHQRHRSRCRMGLRHTGRCGRYWYECRRGNAFTKIVPGLFRHRFLMSFLNGTNLHTLWISPLALPPVDETHRPPRGRGQARRLEAIYR